jgi:hypothetical protein
MFSTFKKTALVLSTIAFLSTSAYGASDTFSPTLSLGSELTVTQTTQPDFGTNISTCASTDTLALSTAGVVTATGVTCANYGGAAAGVATVTGTSGDTASYDLDVITTQPSDTDAAAFSLPVCDWDSVGSSACASGDAKTGTITGGSITVNVGATATIGTTSFASTAFDGASWVLTVTY